MHTSHELMYAYITDTKMFVQHINQHQIVSHSLVQKYLSETLEKGLMAKKANQTKESVSAWKEGLGTFIATPVQTPADLASFFGFEHEKYHEHCKQSAFKFFENHLLAQYNPATVERFHIGDGSRIAIDPKVDRVVENLSGFFDFLVANPQIFAPEDVERFISLYTTTLNQRRTMPRELRQPYWVDTNTIKGAKQLVQSDTYLCTDGVYAAEMPLLEKMSRFLCANSLSTAALQKTVAVPFEPLPHSTPKQYARERDKFFQYKTKISDNIKNPTKCKLKANPRLKVKTQNKLFALKKLQGLLSGHEQNFDL